VLSVDFAGAGEVQSIVNHAAGEAQICRSSHGSQVFIGRKGYWSQPLEKGLNGGHSISGREAKAGGHSGESAVNFRKSVCADSRFFPCAKVP
jgi:hypothetical protein